MAGSRRVFRTPRRHHSSRRGTLRGRSPLGALTRASLQNTQPLGAISMLFSEDFYEIVRMTVLFSWHGILGSGAARRGSPRAYALDQTMCPSNLPRIPYAKGSGAWYGQLRGTRRRTNHAPDNYQSQMWRFPAGKTFGAGASAYLIGRRHASFRARERLPGLEPYFPQCRHQFNHIYVFS